MTSTPWLDTTTYEWFFGPQDIWGHQRPELARDTPQPPNQRPEPIGAELAYAFVGQLHSRITTQKLGFRSGDEATALTSVFQLFQFTREHVERAGPKSHQTADVLWWLLNRDVRPFTARWHRTKEKGLLGIEDVARRFRAELEHLRQALIAWATLLRELAGAALANPPRQLPVRPSPRALPMATAPCQRDGMAAPTPFAKAFADIVAAETELITRWRAKTEREHDLLSGIALSGGGIRSATFALGILRQLALHLDIFGVDYLSTVSGGGYLGTLITMAYESNLVCSDLTRGPLGRDPDRDLGAAVIAWLRGRSDVMKVDLSVAAIGSLGGSIIGIGGGVSDEYRRRLREGWILEPQAPGHGFDPIVLGRSTPSPDLRQLRAAAPLQLWNMALNATNADQRLRVALRGRSCDLYTVSRAGAESRLLGYAPDQAMAVDTAMVISAAACAPTTSEDTGSWLLRIAALAGLNLGRWVDHATGSSRPAGWWERIKSLIGQSEAERGSAFLSDGGHIENLGLYQLLRRRCACILAIDGEEDPRMTFAGLMKLQHLVRVEQGITMDIDVTDLHLGPATDDGRRSDSHFTVIPITYPALAARDGQPAQPEQQGLLVYVKLSLTGDEPQYLRAYRADHPEFPHHSTVHQQAFDDRMFEAYLALGEHVGEQLVSKTWCGDQSPRRFSDWIRQLANRFTEV